MPIRAVARSRSDLPLRSTQPYSVATIWVLFRAAAGSHWRKVDRICSTTDVPSHGTGRSRARKAGLPHSAATGGTERTASRPGGLAQVRNENSEMGWVAWLSICGSSPRASSQPQTLPHPSDSARKALMRSAGQWCGAATSRPRSPSSATASRRCLAPVEHCLASAAKLSNAHQLSPDNADFRSSWSDPQPAGPLFLRDFSRGRRWRRSCG